MYVNKGLLVPGFYLLLAEAKTFEREKHAFEAGLCPLYF